MKNLNKSIVLGTIIASIALLSACSGTPNYSGIFMTDAEKVDFAYNMGNEIFEESDVITKIKFSPKKNSGVTKYAGKMDVYLYEEGVDTLAMITIPLVAKDKKEAYRDTPSKSEIKNNKRENGVKYADIDFSKIPEYLNEAGQMVVDYGKEEEEPLFFSGVGDYTLTYNKDAKNPVHNFAVHSKDTATSSKFMDRFYEFKFQVKDGELKSTK